MNKQDYKDLVGELITENSELKKELEQLKLQMTFGTPTDGLEVGNPEDYGEPRYIYESPDGGKTVFRRPINNYEPKNKEEIVDGEPTGRTFNQYNNNNWDKNK